MGRNLNGTVGLPYRRFNIKGALLTLPTYLIAQHDRKGNFSICFRRGSSLHLRLLISFKRGTIVVFTNPSFWLALHIGPERPQTAQPARLHRSRTSTIRGHSGQPVRRPTNAQLEVG